MGTGTGTGMWLEGDRERLELEGVMKSSPTQAGRVPAKLRDGGLRSASCQWHFCTCWERVEASFEPCENHVTLSTEQGSGGG